MRQSAATLALLLALAAAAWADNWPAWRGPTGQGHCNEKNVPLSWSSKDNVKWKIDLEHQGNSTPIVWGERIFLTQANKGGSVRGLICFDRKEGKKLWQQDVEYKEKETAYRPTWYANASPVTDGKRVVVSYGSAGMYCYDLDGKELWKRTDLGKWEHSFGNSASPVLYGDLAILWCGPNNGKENNYLLAVNKETGKTEWEHKESFGSWSTPLIAKVKGEDQLLVAQSRDVKKADDDKTGFLKGFDPKKGKELWKCQGLNSFQYTSPLVSDDVAVQMSGFGGSAIAVKLGGSGDVTKDRLWKHPSNPQRVGSGVIVGDYVYMVDETGPPRCFELKSGEEVWKAKRPTSAVTWGSMVHADGRLYLLMRNGETLVFAAKPKYELLARNALGKEETNSSLAISDGEVFIRTFAHLWCIAEKKEKK
jgi:outer membrane protein assembly factor BamB